MSHCREFFLNGCIIVGVIFISVVVYFCSRGSTDDGSRFAPKTFDIDRFYCLLISFFSGDCPSGTMACSSGGFCVPQKLFCNQQFDCPDGEDEDPILCTDLYGSTQLVEDIINSSIRERVDVMFSAKTCDLQEYPEECLCRYGRRLYCHDAQLNNIPKTISGAVDYLVLTNNNISSITVDSFEGFNLTLLHMEHNRLMYIEPESFKNQSFLRKLFLMNNALMTIEPGVFHGLQRLEWLHIDSNHIFKFDMSNLIYLQELKWMNISHNRLTIDSDNAFPKLPKLLELYLNNNKIRRIWNNTFEELVQLDLLDLRCNVIGMIEAGAFLELKKLKELDLSENNLRSLPPGLFVSQKRLNKLSLGYNPLKYIETDLFARLAKLQSLHLEEIEITNINVPLFKELKSLQWVYFKTYHYCTFVPFIPRCRPLSDGISSLNQLLFKPTFRYSNWIICLITIGGNGMVLFGRIWFRDENKSLMSDGLMGIYLLIIAFHDLKYRDNYNEMARKWMSSWNCTITGILGMTSMEVSVFVLVFLSVDRYFAITMPLKKYVGLTLRETWRVLFFIWCFGLTIALIPAITYMSSTKFYGVNSLCLPLYIDDPYFVGWEYSAIIFFGINASSVLVIIYTYLGMFVNIRSTRNAVSIPMNDHQFALRFFFIIFANITCWLPILIAKLLVYFKIEIPADVYGWLVVFVLPINSSLNPILYTFTTRKYRNRIVNMPSCIKKMKSSGATSENIKVDQENIDLND